MAQGYRKGMSFSMLWLPVLHSMNPLPFFSINVLGGWLCAGKRNAEILTLLVGRGGKASLNHPEWSRQSKGASPLHTAARLGQVDNAEALLKLGADVNVVDASGQTALHVAAVHEITGRFLLCLYALIHQQRKRCTVPAKHLLF